MRNRKEFEHVMSNVRLRREVRKMKRIAVVSMSALFAGSLLTGCSFAGRAHDNAGRIDISADEAGMNAFSQMLQGAIINGKATEDKDTSHQQTARFLEVERTKRAVDPGVIEAIFAGGNK